MFGVSCRGLSFALSDFGVGRVLLGLGSYPAAGSAGM